MKYLRLFRAACCAPGRFSTSRRAGVPLECFSWYLFFFACPPAGGRPSQKAAQPRGMPPQMSGSSSVMGAEAVRGSARQTARAHGDAILWRVPPGSMLRYRPRLFSTIFEKKLAINRTISVINRTIN